MLGIIGDVHGEYRALDYQVRTAAKAGACACIQVGDLGFYEKTLHLFRALDLPLPVYALDGNHEDFRLLRGITEITEFAPNLYYVPRGTVLELDGRVIPCLGGAGSIDKDYRIQNGWHWYPDEQITDEDVDRLFRNMEGRTPSFMVTHCPPDSVIQDVFEVDPMQKVRDFGVPVSWYDPSALQVEKAWDVLGTPDLYCGHMHRDVEHGSVTILDIAQLVLV